MEDKPIIIFKMTCWHCKEKVEIEVDAYKADDEILILGGNEEIIISIIIEIKEGTICPKCKKRLDD